MKNETGCKQKVLCKNQHGYITKCKDCNHFKIAFGTFTITQTVPEFLEFMVTINRVKEANKQHFNLDPNQKRIELPTILRNISWIFSINDINNLAGLLQKACLNISIETQISRN